MSSLTRYPGSQAYNDNRQAIPTSQYTFQQLAEIYNQARVDYIVPMPMNAKRMQEYVDNYDIDLDGSYVALNSAGEECGIGMLGMRDGRGWITRLGVIPNRRLRHMGQFIMEKMIDYAIDKGAHLVQLEVIVGNDPARCLFEKLGFEETRTLLIIRRPPGMPAPIPEFDDLEVHAIASKELPAYLDQRERDASWVEETPSLLNAGSLQGLRAMLPNGEESWVIFQQTAFQLTHFVISPDVSETAASAALYHVHKLFPKMDTKIENVPENHHSWGVYQDNGYLEVFRRTEMFLYLK